MYATKNKISHPFRSCTADIYFTTGIDKISGLEDVLLETGVIVEDDKQGFYKYKEESFRKSKFAEFFEKHPEMLDEVPPLQNIKL